MENVYEVLQADMLWGELECQTDPWDNLSLAENFSGAFWMPDCVYMTCKSHNKQHDLIGDISCTCIQPLVYFVELVFNS